MSAPDSGEDVDALRRAIRGLPGAGANWLRGEPPAWLDGDGARLTTVPLMAAFLVAAAVLRGRISDSPLDLLGLGLRTVAAVFVIRAAIEIGAAVRRLRAHSNARDQQLAWNDAGLLYHAGATEEFVAWSQVDAVVAPPRARPGRSAQRSRPLYLVGRPGAADVVDGRHGGGPRELPPYFGPDTDVLLARLGKLARGGERPAAPEGEHAGLAAEARYAGAVAGRLEPGSTCVAEATRLWARAPWVAALPALFALDAVRVAPETWRAALMGPALASCALAALIPPLWALWMRRRAAVRGGIGMVLTPTDLLARGAGGATAIPWREVSEIEIQRKAAWSPFRGGHGVSVLEIRAGDGTAARFDAAVLAPAVEAVAALCEAYRSAENARV